MVNIALGIILACFLLAAIPFFVAGLIYLIPVLLVIGGVVALYYNPEVATLAIFVGIILFAMYSAAKIILSIREAGGVKAYVRDVGVRITPAITEHKKIQKITALTVIDVRVKENRKKEELKKENETEEQRQKLQTELNEKLEKLAKAYADISIVRFEAKQDGGYFYIRKNDDLVIDEIYKTYVNYNNIGFDRRESYYVKKGELRSGKEHADYYLANEQFNSGKKAIRYLKKNLRKQISDILSNIKTKH